MSEPAPRAGANGSNGRNYAVDRSRSYRIVENQRVEVYDLDFAAYLLMRDVALAESMRDGREFRFTFRDDGSRIPDLAMEYVNSESAKFAGAVRRLKKVTMNAGSESRYGAR